MGSVILNSDEIKKLIPHREPILLIDQVEVNSDSQTKATFNLETRAHLFAGHFPSTPVLPGIYMVEAMSQAAAAMALHFNPSYIGKPFFFSSIDNVKFRRTILPEDKVVSLEVSIKHQKITETRALMKISGTALVGYELASEALFTGIGIILPV